jgi:hypothetical protein
MFKLSMPLVLGLSLSLAACAAPGSEEPAEETAATEDAQPAAAILDGLGDPALQTAGKKNDGPTIPPPSFGYLAGSNTTGTSCTWTVDGTYLGTAPTIFIAVGSGIRDVACKRADGVTAFKNDVTFTQGQTTSVVLTFPAVANGTLTAVAVGGSCSFLVNGVVKGSGATLSIPLPPAVYSVACKPAYGATQTRSVTITSNQTSMAMFKL